MFLNILKIKMNIFVFNTSIEVIRVYLEYKNFEMRGSSNEFGGYVNTKTGRSYHIDFNNRFNEKPHVDINSLYKSNSLKLKKTKYFIDGNIEKIIK